MQLFAELNTLFHVDNDVAAAAATDRGVVLSADQPLNKGTLGFNSAELITSEFLFPFETFPEDHQAAAKTLLYDFTKAAQVVLVEVGADCDHAQATKRYLVGLEVPQKFMKLATHHKDDKPRSDALQVLGPWRIDEEIRCLLVSCRRFRIWQKRTPPRATIRYRLRSALVNKLLSHYSAWSNRPGLSSSDDVIETRERTWPQRRFRFLPLVECTSSTQSGPLRLFGKRHASAGRRPGSGDS